MINKNGMVWAKFPLWSQEGRKQKTSATTAVGTSGEKGRREGEISAQIVGSDDESQRRFCNLAIQVNLSV